MLETRENLLVYKYNPRKVDPSIGNGIIAFPENYTVIDLETTGLDPKNELIIEYAAVKVRKNKVVDTFQSLCDPGFPISPFIEAITGISTDMVKNSPNPRSILPDFLDFVSDDYIVGHNVLFDIHFISQIAFVFKNDYIDTMKIFRKLHPTLPHHRLSDMVAFYKQHNESAHRALSDCFATNGCFSEMKYDATTLFGSETAFLKSLK